MARVRHAAPADLPAAGRLLHDFNREFDAPAPEPAWIAERLGVLTAADDAFVLLGGDGPDGIAVVLLRPGVWDTAPDAYLAELYVVPALRGRGLGRALLEAAMDASRARGAGRMELNTSQDDVAARGLYASAGFSNAEGGPGGPVMLYFERDL
jgi:ribosomal protein S18 acetylase RimI-like enzyme